MATGAEQEWVVRIAGNDADRLKAAVEAARKAAEGEHVTRVEISKAEPAGFLSSLRDELVQQAERMRQLAAMLDPLAAQTAERPEAFPPALPVTGDLETETIIRIPPLGYLRACWSLL